MGTYPQTDQVFLAGVVSWGIGRSFFTFVTWIQLKKVSTAKNSFFCHAYQFTGCGRKGKYGVYTKVSHYAKWFQRIIKT